MSDRMTPEDVRERVAEIEADSADDEAAHVMEDELYTDVLYAIAHSECDSPKECAAEALKAGEIAFCRWCA